MTSAPQHPQIVCPECGASTWVQLADGFQTIFCFSTSCSWKQQIRSRLRTTTPSERDKVLDELKAWCLKMKCNGCPYGGILFHKMSELRTAVKDGG